MADFTYMPSDELFAEPTGDVPQLPVVTPLGTPIDVMTFEQIAQQLRESAGLTVVCWFDDKPHPQLTPGRYWQIAALSPGHAQAWSPCPWWWWIVLRVVGRNVRVLVVE